MDIGELYVWPAESLMISIFVETLRRLSVELDDAFR